MINLSKHHFIFAASSLLLTALGSANAYDSGSKALANTVGAVDYYQLACPSGTDHASFKIIDQSEVVQPAPQLLNAHLSKVGFGQSDANSLKPSENQTISVSGGSGKYKLSVDSLNTNLELKKAQSFYYQSQCVYADGSTGKLIKSGKKTLKNGNASKPSSVAFIINCAAKKKTSTTAAVEAEKLTVILYDTTTPSNLTASAQLLTAQVTKRDQAPSDSTHYFAANATDVNGDANYGEPIRVDRGTGGTGDFFLTVTSNGTNSALDNSKIYNYQFQCLNSANADVGDPAVTPLQDQ